MTPRCLPATLALAAALTAPFTASAQLALSSGSGRWFYGGGAGFGAGDVTYVQVSPFVGYRLTDEFAAGVGLTYRYRSDTRFGRDLSTHDVGGSVFGRYRLPGPFFAHAEYEYLSYQYYRADLSKARTGVSSVLVGGGISQPLGDHASFSAMVLYNLSYNSYSPPAPYSSPWVLRVGVGIGF